MNLRRMPVLVSALVTILVGVIPVAAQDRGTLAGQVGVTFQSETALVFGGEVGVNVLPVFQVYGTVGRMQDALPSEIQDVLDFFDDGLNASIPTLYALGGVRVMAPRGPFRLYGVFGAGLAHLSGDFEYNGRDITAFIEDELGYSLSSNEFAFEIGGGVLIPFGRAFADAGYRYLRVTGADLNVSRVYGGLGVRF